MSLPAGQTGLFYPSLLRPIHKISTKCPKNLRLLAILFFTTTTALPQQHEIVVPASAEIFLENPIAPAKPQVSRGENQNSLRVEASPGERRPRSSDSAGDDSPIPPPNGGVGDQHSPPSDDIVVVPSSSLAVEDKSLSLAEERSKSPSSSLAEEKSPSSPLAVEDKSSSLAEENKSPSSSLAEEKSKSPSWSLAEEKSSSRVSLRLRTTNTDTVSIFGSGQAEAPPEIPEGPYPSGLQHVYKNWCVGGQPVLRCFKKISEQIVHVSTDWILLKFGESGGWWGGWVCGKGAGYYVYLEFVGCGCVVGGGLHSLSLWKNTVSTKRGLFGGNTEVMGESDTPVYGLLHARLGGNRWGAGRAVVLFRYVVQDLDLLDHLNILLVVVHLQSHPPTHPKLTDPQVYMVDFGVDGSAACFILDLWDTSHDRIIYSHPPL